MYFTKWQKLARDKKGSQVSADQVSRLEQPRVKAATKNKKKLSSKQCDAVIKGDRLIFLEASLINVQKNNMHF